MPSQVVALSRDGLSFEFICVTKDKLQYFLKKDGVEAGDSKTKIIDEMIIEINPGQAFQLNAKIHDKMLKGLLRVSRRTSNYVWKTDLHTYLHPERKDTIPVLSYDCSTLSSFDEETGFLGLVNLAFKAKPELPLPELIAHTKKVPCWRAEKSFTFKLHVPGHLEYETPLLDAPASTVLSATSPTHPQITFLTFEMPFPMPLSEPNPISQSSPRRRPRRKRPNNNTKLPSSNRNEKEVHNIASSSGLPPDFVPSRGLDNIEKLQVDIESCRKLLERKERELNELLNKKNKTRQFVSPP